MLVNSQGLGYSDVDVKDVFDHVLLNFLGFNDSYMDVTDE